MRQPVADHEADGRVVGDTGLAKGRAMASAYAVTSLPEYHRPSNSMHGRSP